MTLDGLALFHYTENAKWFPPRQCAKPHQNQSKSIKATPLQQWLFAFLDTIICLATLTLSMEHYQRTR
jgi:hypothetical protein